MEIIGHRPRSYTDVFFSFTHLSIAVISAGAIQDKLSLVLGYYRAA